MAATINKIAVIPLLLGSSRTISDNYLHKSCVQFPLLVDPLCPLGPFAAGQVTYYYICLRLQHNTSASSFIRTFLAEGYYICLRLQYRYHTTSSFILTFLMKRQVSAAGIHSAKLPLLITCTLLRAIVSGGYEEHDKLVCRPSPI